MAAPFKLKFGSYTHDAGEVQFSISRRQQRSAYTGRRIIEHVEWSITGVLMASSLSALETAIGNLDTAYRTSDGSGDLLFVHADGSTNTKHTILAANTLNGIEIDGPNYSAGPRGVWGFGPEYLETRTYNIRARAIVLLQEGGEQLVSWSETIQQVGDGGPTWMMQDALEGPLMRQQLTPYSPIQYFQSGEAVGLTSAPLPPGPIAPTLEHTDRRRVTPPSLVRPRFNGRVRQAFFPVRWFYHMESAGLVVG